LGVGLFWGCHNLTAAAPAFL
jgi:hypothetical protein